MCDFKNNILDICKNYYSYLINLNNVVGVGLGYKEINTITTNELCIHVLVSKKLDSKHLSTNNLIPKTYMGIKTDVIEIGESKFSSGSLIEKKFRPLEIGCGIGVAHYHKLIGTLGLFVTKKTQSSKEYFILSNNHVLAGFNDVPIGNPILQPVNLDLYAESGEDDIIAYLSDFIPVEFIEFNKEPKNYVDCAIAKVLDKSLISNTILSSVGSTSIKGISTPSLGLKVKKVGLSTGLTEGVIKTIGLTKPVAVSRTKYVLFVDQILADLKGSAGDSGSAVLNYNNEVVGLVMSTSESKNTTTFNDINIVLDKLNVDVYTE